MAERASSPLHTAASALATPTARQLEATTGQEDVSWDDFIRRQKHFVEVLTDTARQLCPAHNLLSRCLAL